MACQTVKYDQDMVEKIKKDLKEKAEELKRKSETITELTTKITVQEAELAALKEERNQLLDDVGNTKIAKDEVVKKAWEVRDKAIARKKFVEIELAKTRIDLMHINSQLIEAIQQKVELSQQLDQWQVDMQALLNEQLKSKLHNQEQEENEKQHIQSKVLGQQKNKLFRLWR
ncbi:bicaudal D-related protein homolog [Tachypleus tridentatus]|uniref:bicaudal D-related protein homolog n=1 Tax=Tachypleus tridentatus TaxID=6853 RepID=UPI003FD53C47